MGKILISFHGTGFPDGIQCDHIMLKTSTTFRMGLLGEDIVMRSLMSNKSFLLCLELEAPIEEEQEGAFKVASGVSEAL